MKAWARPAPCLSIGLLSPEERKTQMEKRICLSSPSACVTVSLSTAVPHLAVIVSLVHGQGPADGQGGHVPRVGARESLKDPCRPVAISIDSEMEKCLCKKSGRRRDIILGRRRATHRE